MTKAKELKESKVEAVYKYFYKSKYVRGEDFINFKGKDLVGEVDEICKELIRLEINKITLTDPTDYILEEFGKYGYVKTKNTKIRTGSFIWVNELGYEDWELEDAIVLER